MPGVTKQYGPGVQYVSNDAPIEDVCHLIERDGAVFVRNFVSVEDVDQASADVKQYLDNAPEWNGTFFPSKFTSILTIVLNTTSIEARPYLSLLSLINSRH